MHKCVVHFVPLYKQLPSRTEHFGFIVQKMYDNAEMKLWELTDNDYEENKQLEIWASSSENVLSFWELLNINMKVYDRFIWGKVLQREPDPHNKELVNKISPTCFSDLKLVYK